MSKKLTVEADNLAEAMEKAQEMVARPIPYKELTPTKLYFDEISPIKWADEEQLKK